MKQRKHTPWMSLVLALAVLLSVFSGGFGTSQAEVDSSVLEYAKGFPKILEQSLRSAEQEKATGAEVTLTFKVENLPEDKQETIELLSNLVFNLKVMAETQSEEPGLDFSFSMSSQAKPEAKIGAHFYNVKDNVVADFGDLFSKPVVLTPEALKNMAGAVTDDVPDLNPASVADYDNQLKKALEALSRIKALYEDASEVQEEADVEVALSTEVKDETLQEYATDPVETTVKQTLHQTTRRVDPKKMPQLLADTLKEIKNDSLLTQTLGTVICDAAEPMPIGSVDEDDTKDGEENEDEEIPYEDFVPDQTTEEKLEKLIQMIEEEPERYELEGLFSQWTDASGLLVGTGYQFLTEEGGSLFQLERKMVTGDQSRIFEMMMNASGNQVKFSILEEQTEGDVLNGLISAVSFEEDDQEDKKAVEGYFKGLDSYNPNGTIGQMKLNLQGGDEVENASVQWTGLVKEDRLTEHQIQFTDHENGQVGLNLEVKKLLPEDIELKSELPEQSFDLSKSEDMSAFYSELQSAMMKAMSVLKEMGIPLN